MDEQAKKILGNIWAGAAPSNRRSPEDAGIDRSQGWDANYEQAGTFKFPERTVFNQLVCELTAFDNEWMTYGFLRWDAEVEWSTYDFVMHKGVMYVALQANGPSTDGGAEEPGTGTRWRVY